jgi:hypothetical protein
MQPVPCLRISERPVRFPSDHNTRWRLPFTQIKTKDPETNRESPRRREGATPITLITSGCIILDKNISLLNINDLFKMSFYLL